jgi:hypothetical protein
MESSNARKIAPGVYVVNESLHLDLGELLVAYGYADTPANREILAASARVAAAREFPGVPIVED